MAGKLSIENGSPVRAKGSKENVLDGLVALAAGIELAAALRLAEMDPVRRAVASLAEALRFDKRLDQQMRGRPVAGTAG